MIYFLYQWIVDRWWGILLTVLVFVFYGALIYALIVRD